MTLEEALDGFPLHMRMRTALSEFMGIAAPKPKGVNLQTIANLKQRKIPTSFRYNAGRRISI
jgi:hypothetical protein